MNPATCPICNRPNLCGMAEGQTTCWCFEAIISPEVMQKIPAASQGKECICQQCAATEGNGSL